jgi:hypothetical protein
MTFVGAVVASIACMACCLRVRGAAHVGGTRQARQSRHAASESIAEDRPGSDAQLLSSTGGRARRRFSGRPSVDITSSPARTWSATRMSEAQIGRDWPSTRNPKIRAGHATAHEERSANRRSDRSRRCPRKRSSRPGRSSTQSGERLARLAIDRASRKRDMAASMWLVRCGCRRRSKATMAPALVGRGLRRGSLCRRAPPCPTWAMAAADRKWVTTPIPVRPPAKTLALRRSVVKGV